MEWTEMQAMWQQYDVRLAENTRINKEILRRMLSTKPERRVSWVKLQMIGNIFLMPIITLLFLTLSPVKFNHGLALYLGIFLFGSIASWNYYLSIKYFTLLRKIDFTHSVVTTRKDLEQLEKHQTIRLRLTYVLMPIALIGVFLLFDMHIPRPISLYAITPLMLCFVVMIVSLYFKFRWKNWWFKKLNAELDEIEDLEKE